MKTKLELLYEIAEEKSLELEEYTNIAKDTKDELNKVLKAIEKERLENQPKIYVGKIYTRKVVGACLLTITLVGNKLRVFNLTHQSFWTMTVGVDNGFDIYKPIRHSTLKLLSKSIDIANDFVEMECNQKAIVPNPT